MKKVLYGILVLAILFLMGYLWLWPIIKIAKLPDFGIAFPIEGRLHVADGSKVVYKTNPPSSGNHYALPAPWGVYDKSLPDETLVHNLEHGGVWISYKPTISQGVIDRLKEIAKKYKSKVILEPRAANDADIALTSWGRIFKFNLNQDGSFDIEAINNYILKYRNTGPEIVPDMGV